MRKEGTSATTTFSLMILKSMENADTRRLSLVYSHGR
jgi:hypothetical protein